MRTLKDIYDELSDISLKAHNLAQEIEQLSGVTSNPEKQIVDKKYSKKVYPKKRVDLLRRGGFAEGELRDRAYIALENLEDMEANRAKLARKIGFRYSATLYKILRTHRMTKASANLILDYYSKVKPFTNVIS